MQRTESSIGHWLTQNESPHKYNVNSNFSNDGLGLLGMLRGDTSYLPDKLQLADFNVSLAGEWNPGNLCGNREHFLKGFSSIPPIEDEQGGLVLEKIYGSFSEGFVVHFKQPPDDKHRYTSFVVVTKPNLATTRE